MVEESERVLTVAEEFLPAVAQELGLAIIEAESVPYTNPGSEGRPSRFVFSLNGEFAGELPTQRALEDAIIAAGFPDIITEKTAGQARPGTDEKPRVVAQNEDGSVQISIQLVEGMAKDGFRFGVHSRNSFHISDEAKREYFQNLVPEFDQSLVQPRKGIDEMTRIADRAVTDAEQLLPEIAQALDLTLTQARVLPQSTPPADGEADQFIMEVHGDFQGALPTQLALEDAMIAAGLTAAPNQSKSFNPPGSDEYPAFAAATPDGFLLVRVWAGSPHEHGLLNFTVEAAPESGFSRTAYQEFDPEALEFDQSLVQPRDSD